MTLKMSAGSFVNRKRTEIRKIKDIKVERKKAAQIELEKKQIEMKVLQEQYYEAIKLKKLKHAGELSEHINAVAKNIMIQSLHDKIIEEESEKLVQYYNNLYKISEDRQLQLQKCIKELKSDSKTCISITKNDSEPSSDISFTTVYESMTDIKSEYALANVDNEMINEDFVNANSLEDLNEKTQENNNFQITRSKMKPLDLKLSITSVLTEAQKNKLKVMSSEFGIEVNRSDYINANKQPSMLQVNRNKMMSSSDCLSFKFNNLDVATQNAKNDNDIFLSKDSNKSNSSNIISDNHQDIKLIKSPKFELEKVSPMSVDSTSFSNLTTPSKLMIDFDQQSISDTSTEAMTAGTQSENCFVFKLDCYKPVGSEFCKSTQNLLQQIDSVTIPKIISYSDTINISANCLKIYLQQSITIPLTTQIKLVTNELFKYYIDNLEYLKHLNSLRNYFFLLDGEFARNITENLFKKLYDVNFPIELINGPTLQVLVYKALDYSTKLEDNSHLLSFRINNLPKMFDLRDPNILDCISLTYKIHWPLNILLPSDTILKYDEIFKFLLKLHRLTWVLQNIFQDLKLLETKSKLSTQCRRLHQCRHVMTHFIYTLQCYVVGEVLHTSWEIFEKNLESVTSFDQLYMSHISYIKNILFMCFLKQKSASLKNVLHKIFIVILKFYDYLRSRAWITMDDVFVHPNFNKLENIFSNFEDLVFTFFKLGYKVVRSGYQPHLLQLLDMLDVNGYYSRRSNI